MTGIDDPRQWHDDRIRQAYDRDPGMTVASLAMMTGKSSKAIKRILTGGTSC